MDFPRDPGLDNTLALLREGYLYIPNRCRRYHSDVFKTRLLLQDTICMSGAEAAALFYDADRFVRKGAAPMRVQKTLFGVGGVQGLDGERHLHRKLLFMPLMDDSNVEQLVRLTALEWDNAIARWERRERIVLFDEVQEILCRAVCAWVGVPLPEPDVAQRTADFAAMIEAGGKVGPAHWRGRHARKRTERWIVELIHHLRTQPNPAMDHRMAELIASYRGLDGELLSEHVAAVELINVIRPTIAIGRFIVFAALALHEHPECRQGIAAADEQYREWFVQEVRRYYPFFPFVAARVRKDFEWHGYRFRKGTRVMLDLYGTNHDGRAWREPDKFQPERFRTWGGSAYNFIPQGGSDVRTQHRCPGEPIVIALVKDAVRILVERMRYEVPEQDLRVSLSRIPTLPESRFVISGVKRAGE